MRSQKLGCITPIGIVASLITGLAMAITGFTWGGAMFSPGGLNAASGPALGGVTAHADLGNKCSACHTAPWDSASIADRCAACHIQQKADMADPSTLHGALVRTPQEAFCLNCHTEHHGPQAMITRVDIQNFPHDVTGFSLKSHAKMPDGAAFACKDCHKDQFQKISDSTCENCHKRMDATYMTGHKAAFGSACFECHDGVDRFGKNFNHSQTAFALAGAHQPLTCERCHINQTTIKAIASTPQECAACHKKDDAHQGILGTDCAACHNPEAWKPVNFDHKARTGFALTGKHAEASCTTCHTSPDLKNTPQECAACHQKDDAHQGKLGADCAACHTPEQWKPSTFDHAKTGFALTGKHIGPACTTCHTNPDLKNTPKDCAGCHSKDDAHQGRLGTNCAACHNPEAWKPSSFNHAQSAFQLVGKHQTAACASCHQDKLFKGTPTQCIACHRQDDTHKGQMGTDCATCHTPAAWKPSTFNHARSAFALTGAHQRAQCTSCHAGGVFKGTPTSCAACHTKDDRHNGQFGSDCAACHTTAAWKPSTFDHARSAFPLTGSHQGVQCASCHAGGKFRGTPTACVACHAADDRHNGQFGTDCAACHKTDRWSNVTFDHSRTRFALTGAHAGLPCARCHSSTYRGTPTECKACHAEPAIHAGMFLADCGTCHNTSAWMPVNFNGPHSFPMNHGGARSCRDCHTSSLTSFTCYTCHNQGEIAKKHQEEGIPDFSNCIACHPDGRKHEGD